MIRKLILLILLTAALYAIVDRIVTIAAQTATLYAALKTRAENIFP